MSCVELKKSFPETAGGELSLHECVFWASLIFPSPMKCKALQFFCLVMNKSKLSVRRNRPVDYIRWLLRNTAFLSQFYNITASFPHLHLEGLCFPYLIVTCLVMGDLQAIMELKLETSIGDSYKIKKKTSNHLIMNAAWCFMEITFSTHI